MTRAWMAVAVAAAISLGACRENDQKTDVRTLDADELAREGKLTLADSQVVMALRSAKDPGRIIYDAPTDLSLASAMRTRPDLVRGDTTRRDTSRTAARRDTTGGDATADTSGGAARARPPRRP
jgi:hypothetical protein